MSLNFEALVGHLYVVGGRSISTTPPGALVEVAPKRAARGREIDTFFTLILPSGDLNAPSTFFEQMAQLAAERFFNTSGSVTSALRAVLTTLNQNLFEHNQRGRERHEANIMCAVLHGDDLYLARVGANVAILRQGKSTETFPVDLSDDDSVFAMPLGVQPAPEFKMSRYKIQAGARLALANPGLVEFDMRKIDRALAEREIADTLLRFKALPTSQLTLMAVEFVVPEGLAIPKPAQPAITTPANPSVQAPGTTATAIMEMPEATSSSFENVVEEAEIRARRGLGTLVFGLAKLTEVLGKLLDRIIPAPADGQRNFISAPAITGIVLLVPIAVVLAVLGLWLSGTGASEFELCVREATETAEIARQIPTSDRNGVLTGWNAVLATTERCGSIREGDPTLADLRLEGRTIVDRLFNIDRRDARPIAAFTNATLSRVILQGLDLFALDDRNDLVYRVTLTGDGRNAVPNSQQPMTTMRRGAAINEFILGDLIDITWANSAGGLSQDTSLVGMDRNGVLVDCSPRFQQTCGAQRLLATENWINPVAITFWEGRLYVLDPGANQIWRYEPAGSAYPNPPVEYFFGQQRPDIRTAVDFGIDDSGNIFVLHADGTLRKYFLGERQNFGYASFPEGSDPTTANGLFLNTSPIAQVLLVADQTNRSIYETTLAGTFISSYRATDEEQFNSLASVVSDASREVIYATSGNSIFAFERLPAE